MNVLVILNRNETTGPNIVAVNVISALTEMNVNVHVVFIKKSRNLNASLSIPSRVFITELQGSLYNKVDQLRKYIDEYSPEVVHSHCFFPDFFNILTGFFNHNHSTVNTIHNIPQEDYLIRYGYIKGGLLWMCHSILNQFFDGNICVSNSVRRKLFNLVSSKKKVIYNSVEERFGSHFKKTTSKLILIYCGHFSKLKNPLLIINALKSINKDFEFIGLGNGELLAECLEITKNDKRFNFPGRVKNVHEYLNQAHCLIHFSRTEGFCLAVAEALVSRMSVISNDLPVIHEFKERFRAENIYICDVQELHDFLISTLDDISLKIKSENFNILISEEFKKVTKPSLIANEHMQLYESITNSKK